MRHLDKDYNALVSSLVNNASNTTADSCWFLPCKNANLFLQDPNLEECHSTTVNCSITIDAAKIGGDLSIYNNSFNVEGCSALDVVGRNPGSSGILPVKLDGDAHPNDSSEGYPDPNLPPSSSFNNWMLLLVGVLLMVLLVFK